MFVQAGDPTEVGGAASVFSETRSADKPLIIGSVSLRLEQNIVCLLTCGFPAGRSKATLGMRSQLLVYPDS